MKIPHWAPLTTLMCMALLASSCIGPANPTKPSTSETEAPPDTASTSTPGSETTAGPIETTPAGEPEKRTVTYSISAEDFANPERGLYHHTETFASGYTLLSETTLSEYPKKENITQILRVFYLSNEGDIPSDYLANMQTDFDTARNAGIKIIARFAYSQGVTAPYNDATPATVLSHIEQLAPLLQANSDVLHVMQAGFIGTWGEWYFTDHFADSPGVLSQQNIDDHRSVTEALLAALPTDRMIQLRTPAFKQSLYSPKALTEKTAFGSTESARIGHHNDCFLASDTDFGTYVNPALDKTYIGQETQFVPMGGETCGVSEFSTCENALKDLQNLHFSYLNIDYNTTVLDSWKADGCFDTIKQNLGYRIHMTDSEFTSSASPGSAFSTKINLFNKGFAGFYNPRPVELVLKNENVEYSLTTDIDAREWPINEDFNINVDAALPADIAPGTYELFLALPDSDKTLKTRPNYSARLANDDVWVPSSGLNKLGGDIIVDKNDSATPPSDKPLFEKVAG